MIDTCTESYGTAQSQPIQHGSMAFLPILLDKEEAQAFVPFPLFPEPWIFQHKVPAGYCLSWTHPHQDKHEPPQGELSFMIWSAYGPHKGFCAIRTYRSAVNEPTSGLLTALHTNTAEIQPLSHPFLYGGEIIPHFQALLHFRTWSPLPFVTAHLPVTFLTVIGGRVHRFGLNIRGHIRLAACDVNGDSLHSLPLPNWSPLFGMQIYRATFEQQAAVEIDLKCPNIGKPRCFVAPAAAS